jgi:hypothetical protein
MAAKRAGLAIGAALLIGGGAIGLVFAGAAHAHRSPAEYDQITEVRFARLCASA